MTTMLPIQAALRGTPFVRSDHWRPPDRRRWTSLRSPPQQRPPGHVVMVTLSWAEGRGCSFAEWLMKEQLKVMMMMMMMMMMNQHAWHYYCDCCCEKETPPTPEERTATTMQTARAPSAGAMALCSCFQSTSKWNMATSKEKRVIFFFKVGISFSIFLGLGSYRSVWPIIERENDIHYFTIANGPWWRPTAKVTWIKPQLGVTGGSLA